VHVAAWRRGRRGIRPIHRYRTATVSLRVFPFRSFLVEEYSRLSRAFAYRRTAKCGRLKRSRGSYSATLRRHGSPPL
jgi:hypothetical protein